MGKNNSLKKMHRLNTWFLKTGLLVAALLLWSGGAQAENSLQDLSEAEGVTCAQGDLRSCLIYYYLVEPDADGELRGLADTPRSSALSPRLEAVQVLLEEQKLGGQLDEELQQLYAPADASEDKKKAVADRWQGFKWMLGRLDWDATLKASGEAARADYPLDELYAADGRDAGGVGVGLGGIFVYHQFSRREPPGRSQKGDLDGDRGGGAGWRVVCDCEHDCDAGVLSGANLL